MFFTILCMHAKWDNPIFFFLGRKKADRKFKLSFLYFRAFPNCIISDVLRLLLILKMSVSPPHRYFFHWKVFFLCEKWIWSHKSSLTGLKWDKDKDKDLEIRFDWIENWANLVCMACLQFSAPLNSEVLPPPISKPQLLLVCRHKENQFRTFCDQVHKSSNQLTNSR